MAADERAPTVSGPGRTAAPVRTPRRAGTAGRRPPSRIEAPSDRVIRSQVEPRIVERRRQVHDAARRRRQRGWVALAVLLALLAAAVGVLVSPLTDVDHVVVTGAQRLSPEQLESASGVVVGDQLVSLDLAAVRDELRSMPWVSSATVARRWPDTVEVHVLEEHPALVVDVGSLTAVVSRTGRVLAIEGDDSAAVDTSLLPRLEVADGGSVGFEVGDDVPDAVRLAATVFARMSDAVRSELPVARLDVGGSLSFTLGEATVVFGPVEDVPEKLATIEAMLSQVVRDCMATVDVREPARPTVARVEGCALPEPLDVGAPADSESDAGSGAESTASGQGDGGA